ncbi:HNH endonuclease signature motif containing protein [Bacillus cereus group sp. BceL297]|uniref:HNH endonuclease signature motif containing protein n=1 Tax=unclassified Bacillus cereus group TaxID=2750818 RepID=UPI003F265F4F
MTKQKNSITGYEIFEYWKDQMDLNGTPFIVDWGEKECFACGKFDYFNEKDEMNDSEDDFKSFWNKKTKLEKAHIIPKQFGGTYEPSNIMFLCKKCHKESPDFINKEMFLYWITSKRESSACGFDILSIFNELDRIIEVYNKNPKYDFTELNIEKIANIVSKYGPQELKEHAIGKLGTHGMEFADSSRAAAVVDFAIHKLKEGI